jgi:hypothetical protein
MFCLHSLSRDELFDVENIFKAISRKLNSLFLTDDLLREKSALRNDFLI